MIRHDAVSHDIKSPAVLAPRFDVSLYPRRHCFPLYAGLFYCRVAQEHVASFYSKFFLDLHHRLSCPSWANARVATTDSSYRKVLVCVYLQCVLTRTEAVTDLSFAHASKDQYKKNSPLAGSFGAGQRGCHRPRRASGCQHGKVRLSPRFLFR